MNVTDPVCGKPISLDQAVEPVEHKGWAYFFCSIECWNAFLATPSRYLAPLGMTRPRQRDAQDNRRS